MAREEIEIEISRSGKVTVTGFRPAYGLVTVVVTASDAAGNNMSKTWSFSALGTVNEVCASAACHGTRVAPTAPRVPSLSIRRY